MSVHLISSRFLLFISVQVFYPLLIPMLSRRSDINDLGTSHASIMTRRHYTNFGQRDGGRARIAC